MIKEKYDIKGFLKNSDKICTLQLKTDSLNIHKNESMLMLKNSLKILEKDINSLNNEKNRTTNSESIENKILNSKISLKDLNEYIDNESYNYSESDIVTALVFEVKRVEKNEKIIINLMETNKREELSRLSAEFLTNEYERIFKVNISQIFSCIVGEAECYNELKKFLVQKQNYYKSLELCRNFTVFNAKYDKIYSSLFKKNKEEMK